MFKTAEEKREAHRRASRRYYQRNYQRRPMQIKASRDGHLRRKYGISTDDYNRLLKEQGGVCAICKNPERVLDNRGRKRRLAVDHDHDTFVVRGLLCYACNTGIGALKESVLVLESAIEYLQRF